MGPGSVIRGATSSAVGATSWAENGTKESLEPEGEWGGCDKGAGEPWDGTSSYSGSAVPSSDGEWGGAWGTPMDMGDLSKALEEATRAAARAGGHDDVIDTHSEAADERRSSDLLSDSRQGSQRQQKSGGQKLQLQGQQEFNSEQHLVEGLSRGAQQGFTKHSGTGAGLPCFYIEAEEEGPGELPKGIGSIRGTGKGAAVEVAVTEEALKGVPGEAWEGEGYEYDKALTADRAFLKFRKRINRHPEQCVR